MKNSEITTESEEFQGLLETATVLTDEQRMEQVRRTENLVKFCYQTTHPHTHTHPRVMVIKLIQTSTEKQSFCFLKTQKTSIDFHLSLK